MKSDSAPPLRILQLLPALNEGGVERGTVELSREFTTRGADCIVVSKGGKLVPQLECDGARHVALDVASKNPFTVPWRAARLRRLFRELEPSIIHARSRVPAWLCVLANRNPRRPFITTVYGISCVNPYSRVMTFGEEVICVSEVVAAHIQRHYGTPAERITLIQGGVDLRTFDPAKVAPSFVAEFRSTHGLGAKRVLMSAGRVTRLKGYEDFIDALKLASASRHDLVGVIVGGADGGKEYYLAELQQRTARLGIAGRIVFAGSQSRMPEFYALADVMVNCSPIMPNVQRTIVESLAMNTPVLATHQEGLNHLVRDEVNGFIIKTHDPSDLADKAMKALEMPRKAIRGTISPAFSLEAMVEATLGTYRKLLA